MEWTDLHTYGLLGTLIAVGTVIATFQKVFKNFRKERDEHSAKILQAAKEEDQLLKAKLEARIDKLDAQMKNLEVSVNKDMDHLKETYTSEIKNLGDKIDTLRDELNQRHSSLIELLTKIITKK